MKRAWVLFAAGVTFLAPPAFAQAPPLNVNAICKTRAADARALRSTADQSIADCVHDEEAAKQQLSGLWASTPARIRNQCESEARSLGTRSYLDILTCVQMVEEMKADSEKKTGK